MATPAAATPEPVPEIVVTAPAPAVEPDGQVWLDIRFVAIDGAQPLDLADGEARPRLARTDAGPASEPIATTTRVRRVAQEVLEERLERLQDDGELRILAQTSLLASSGATAELDGGGLSPVAQPETGGVALRPYGGRVVLQPVVHADGAIRLSIHAQAAGDEGRDDGPREVETTERLRHGETLFVTHVFEDAAPPPPTGWFARTPIGKMIAKARPPPAVRQTQLAVIVTARLPTDSNPPRLMAALTAEDLEAPATPRARDPPLPTRLARLARSVFAPPFKTARAGVTWSARLMLRAGRSIAHA